jgi:hypothetical protein
VKLEGEEWAKPEGNRPKPLSGDEPFMGIDATVRDYWIWSTSDLQEDTARGILAEFLVAKALGAEGELRVSWANFDVTDPETRARVEVKSTARLQSWAHRRLSAVSFRGLTARSWDERKGFSAARQVRADVFVFAIQACEDPEAYDALDVAQWEFYVAPASAVRDHGTRSVGRGFLNQNATGPLPWSELADAIRTAAPEQR